MNTLPNFTWLESTMERFDEKLNIVPTAAIRRLERGLIFLMGDPMNHDDRGNGLYQVHRHNASTGYQVGSRPITGAEFDSL